MNCLCVYCLKSFESQRPTAIYCCKEHEKAQLKEEEKERRENPRNYGSGRPTHPSGQIVDMGLADTRLGLNRERNRFTKRFP